MFACLFVAYLLLNGWTIWLNFYLLAPSWSRDGFRPKKISDPGSGFSENPEKSIFPQFLLIYSKYLLAKIFEFIP